MSQSKTYVVEGMTCEHCRLSVSEELLELAGVESVDVDLAAGRVTVRGEDVADAAVRTAVETAGYRVPVEQP